MTSARKAAANRRNAQKSTGPRTLAGKRRASRNSYRHGLSARVPEEQFRDDTRKLAQEINRSCPRITSQEALQIADATLQIEQVRRVRTALFEQGLRTFETIQNFQSALAEAESDLGSRDHHDVEIIKQIVLQLQRLDRYKRKAMVDRDRVVRAIARGRRA